MLLSIIIFLGMAMIFALIGILIKHFKCYWLISGYNTASKQQKDKIDIVGLGNLMGNYCFFLVGLFCMLGILNYFKIDFGTVIIFPLIFISTIYLIIRVQKYDMNPKSAKIAKITAIIMGIGFIIIFGMILYGARETKVIVNQQRIEIKGMYGQHLEMNKISEVALKDSMPRVRSKVNGFNFGKVLKGNFNLNELGTGKIFIYSGKSPYIYIIYGNDYVIVNQKNENKTKELYNLIIEHWEK